MGPQGPKDVSRDIARHLTALVREIAALMGDTNHWLEGPEHATLKHRLEYAHAAIEAALIEARRRVRLVLDCGPLPLSMLDMREIPRAFAQISPQIMMLRKQRIPLTHRAHERSPGLPFVAVHWRPR
jgi:hypothetical protein